MEYKLYRDELLRNAQKYSKRLLTLPLHLEISRGNVVFISEKLIKTLSK